MSTFAYQTIRNTAKHWWLVLTGGVVLTLLGIWMLVFPVQSYISLSFAFALVILTAGVFEFTFAVFNLTAKGWGLTLLSGLADLFIGGYLYSHPAITMTLLPFILGFWLLFRGILAIWGAWGVKSFGFDDWAWLMLVGIAIVLFAIVVLTNPLFGALNIVIWTGVAFVSAGAFRIYLSFKLRDLKNRLPGH
ncbi:DUF308 domain-containing protein [Mucilaginibacter sp. RS28]|uniref:DUF308 domain-containing protein n=1 Tax=Mucilaginibacter straminoryzae TaxID=2932774 RepID=A0A9X1WZ70_9SPHI|nr:DUF308 domain-containing protein [Mucilaginibacter straminoryzae]MCJ8208347.1 DUF308 domain-containing protein [Mucilaginibacter straminoryzae]